MHQFPRACAGRILTRQSECEPEKWFHTYNKHCFIYLHQFIVRESLHILFDRSKQAHFPPSRAPACEPAALVPAAAQGVLATHTACIGRAFGQKSAEEMTPLCVFPLRCASSTLLRRIDQCTLFHLGLISITLVCLACRRKPQQSPARRTPIKSR